MSGRLRRATVSTFSAETRTCGAIAYAAQQKRHISEHPRAISMRSLSDSSVCGVRIVVCGRLAQRALGTLELLDDDLSVLGGFGAGAVDGGHVETLDVRERGDRPLAGEVAAQDLGDLRHELLAVAHREDVHPEGERRRVDARAIPADENDRVAFAALLALEGDARRRQEPQEVDVVHLPGDRERDEREVAERRVRLERSRPAEVAVVLHEEAVARDVFLAVEEAVDPLEPEVRHPDLVGVREAERDARPPVAGQALRGALGGEQRAATVRTGLGHCPP